MNKEVIIYDVENLPFGSKITVDGIRSIKTSNSIVLENGMEYSKKQKVILGW